MLDQEVILQIERAAGKSGAREAPMERFTSFGCGGPAALMIEAEDRERLAAILSTIKSLRLPSFVIGRGTNILVADDGFPGVAISLSGGFRECDLNQSRLVCGAAVTLPRAANLAAEAGLSGLEPLAHIPGTLGGAVVMNAGAFGAAIGYLVEWAEVCLPGELRKLDRQALAFGYRSSAITSNMVVTRVALALRPGNQEEIRRQMIDFRAQREAAQPRGARSFGSAFKNPPGMSAGRMLDDTGCKELIVGGAAVSAAHANFIINRGNATTADVVELMNRCRRRVFDRYGVRLDPEVRFLGDIGLEEL